MPVVSSVQCCSAAHGGYQAVLLSVCDGPMNMPSRSSRCAISPEVVSSDVLCTLLSSVTASYSYHVSTYYPGDTGNQHSQYTNNLHYAPLLGIGAARSSLSLLVLRSMLKQRRILMRMH